ncbi:hypothetical protein [Azospirillum sp. TSO22-1]|uniref:hypothetical protein n=1 Tax=Azospirillum sp. TSO22-1 TaxID=716789 RepID=UPI000D60C845|nr:hypothetical protein [Azospirillum sp. TSO22-1]PWC55016.1 hypothetical protein TSO221_06280 [Azospirillum sp. TSO22-1]
MSLPVEITEARDTIARAERFRRVWRTVRVAMLVVLAVFLALLVVYTALAFAAAKGAWHYVFMLVGDGFLAFLIVVVLRHRGTDRMFDAEIATATGRLAAAGWRPVRRDGRVLVAPTGAPDESAVEA